jgi:hypothetical protein
VGIKENRQRGHRPEDCQGKIAERGAKVSQKAAKQLNMYKIGI